MALLLDVFLVAGRYDAGGGQDPRAYEWPPHHARVLSALRSVATEADLDALRMLESLGAPRIHASELVGMGQTRTYVVTNATDKKGGNLSHPARTSGLRERRTAFPLDPHVQLVWVNDAGVTDDLVTHLDAVARRVPYLGRSTSTTLMGVRRVANPTAPPGLGLYEPTREPSTFQLRVPYSGYTDELTQLFEEGAPSWQASDGGRSRQQYRFWPGGVVAAPAPEASIWASPYPDLVVLKFLDEKPSGRLTTLFTQALRSKVMSQTRDPLPPALHGHGLEGQPHVAYLALPFSGYDHADGHLVGLAVAIPGLDQKERRAVLRGLLGSDPSIPVELAVPALKKSVALAYAPDDWRPFSARPERWNNPSTQWVTVTPIVLDRFPKTGDLSHEVARSVAAAGFPIPSSVEVSRLPLTHGAVSLTPAELPRRARGRIYCHARVAFDQPVSGPVLAGAGRYFGVGLFAPEATEEPPR